jgi:hypothetical protein
MIVRLSLVIAALSLSTAAWAEDAPAAPPAVPPALPAAPAAQPVPGSAGTAGVATTSVPAPEAQKPQDFPLHASASITHSAGTGTFVVSGYNNPTIQGLGVLSGNARINDAWSASAMLRMAWEYTDSDSDTYNHQIDLFDPRFGVSYKAWDDKDLGLGLGLSGGYSLPLSLGSRAVGSTGIFSLGARLGWAVPPVSGLSFYGVLGVGDSYNDAGLRQSYFEAAAGKPFVATNNENTTTLSCAQGTRGGSDVGNGACSSAGRGFRWNAGVGGAYSFLDDQLAVSLDMTYLQSFGEFQPSNTGSDNLGYLNSELSSKNAAGAFPLEAGVITIGSIGVSWSPVKWFTLTGGTYTAQPLITGGNSGNVVRWFPLWDMGSLGWMGNAKTAVDNYSSVFIDTTFSI